MSWSDELDVIKTVRHLEGQYTRYLQNKGPSPECEELKTTPCITTYTQLLREKAWQVTMEGMASDNGRHGK
ncbi:unnamed protein product [Lasius platythorax]|uniref:Uncharacterized protein n=1 Tax=Lasius platythorax TaxID=488582 RepID=A0AAV2MY86_9HYME